MVGWLRSGGGIVLALTLLVSAVLVAPAALAVTDPDVAAAAARDQGYYIEPGADAGEDAVAAVVADARNQGIRLNVIILEDDPPGGATVYADAVLDRLGTGTVIVLTASLDAGAASTEFTFAELNAALDAADAAGGDDPTYAAAFAGALAQIAAGEEPPPASSGGDESDGGSGGMWIFLLIVVAIVGVVAWLLWRQNRQRKERLAGQVADARQELRAQLDAVANDVLALSDRPELSSNEEASAHYAAASATYTEADDAFAEADTLGEAEELFEDVDEATWQLDAAEALLDGKAVPPRPEERKSLRCFFDPTHPGPFEDAEIETAKGKEQVRVCRRDADRLRQGSSPEPRMVNVGGSRVPAAAAPRSSGGGGFGGLDAFSILVGGMAASRSQRWGSPSRRTRRAERAIDRSASRTRRSSSSSGRSRSSRSRSTTRARTGRRRRR